MPLKLQNIVPLFTITGVVVAIISLLINTSIKKEEFFLRLSTEYSQNGIHDIFLRVMHTENWYSDKFSNGKFEQDIDKMLMFFNGIIYIKKRHLISQRSFSIFEYMLKKLISDRQTQHYIYDIYHYSVENKSSFPFDELYEYAKKRNILAPEYFIKKESDSAK